MIIVHDIFVCKPGQAGKLAKMFKESMVLNPMWKYVLTDLSGQWHRVIMVSEHESLAAYEAESKRMMESPTEAEKQDMERYKDMNEMYLSGSREIYKAW